MSGLEKLKQHREEILKAELAAWLHDWQKCIDMAVASHWKKNKFVDQSKIVEWQSRGKKCAPKSFSDILGKHKTSLCQLPNQLPKSIPIKELIETGRDPSKAEKSEFYLVTILGRAHGAGHIEKELETNEYLELATDWSCTSFGYERFQPRGFLCRLLKEPADRLSRFFSEPLPENLKAFLRDLEPIFKEAWGDTRRPINEVTLWDWSSIVAALYKAEIAQCVITNEKREPKNIKWRLLSIRTDGLGYLLSANSIPDILARKELLKDAFDRVQKLLEEEYPLGLEVYRDENGSVFVVPDLKNLLGLTDRYHNNKTLREFIIEHFQSGTVKDNMCLAIQGEIEPNIYFDTEPWDGQTQLPPIGEHLENTPPLQSDPLWVKVQWCSNKDEICTVCGLRPTGPSQKARDRKVCDVCEKRREDRAYEWATKKLNTTIWIDEVSDKNGRIALIVGKFDLTHWLDGTLVRTLAVREPNDNNGHTADKVAKNPSFARLRRIWETTKKFWEDIEEAIKEKTKREKRYYFEVLDKPNLGFYHAYEIHLGRVKIPVLWDTNNKRLWIIDNPDYLSSPNQLGKDLENALKRLENKTIPIFDPAGYGKKSEKIGEVKIGKLNSDNQPYSASISILTEPQTFMAIVPANKAIEILEEIKAKYEREMGKVRNRLPLHMGVVFANRMIPLRAIMDAGRRMLKQKAKPEVWKVVCCARKQISKGDALPQHLQKDQGSQFKEWFEVYLKAENKKLTWYVPALMGDGQTEDKWYPYVFLATPDKPINRKRYYQTDMSNPWNKNHNWLVHAGELEVEDKIYFTPATLDFIFLDSNTRRFDVIYDDSGKRASKLQWTRPYLLDELDKIEDYWNKLSHFLSTNQILQIRDLIETKRAEWFENPEDSVNDAVFKKFCSAVIRNAEWKKGNKPDEQTIQSLIDGAISGLLKDVIELYHSILKERPEDEQQD